MLNTKKKLSKTFLTNAKKRDYPSLKHVGFIILSLPFFLKRFPSFSNVFDCRYNMKVAVASTSTPHNLLAVTSSHTLPSPKV
jgi:hypothetical protein